MSMTGFNVKRTDDKGRRNQGCENARNVENI